MTMPPPTVRPRDLGELVSNSPRGHSISPVDSVVRASSPSTSVGSQGEIGPHSSVDHSHVGRPQSSSRAPSYAVVPAAPLSTQARGSKTHPIIAAAREGDLKKIRSLYERGEVPPNAVLIGIPVELSEGGNVGAGAVEYFKRLACTRIAQTRGVPVVPIPVDSLYGDRARALPAINKTKRERCEELVKREWGEFDGIVITGDPFNFPPLRANDDPYAEIFRFKGSREIHGAPTIYGGLSGREFYQRYPDHSLNPTGESLQYEAAVIRHAESRDTPLMTSCHGTQLLGVLHGACMRAGISGHEPSGHPSTGPWLPVNLKPGTMHAGMLGSVHSKMPHVHRLALDSRRFPEDLALAGTSDEGIVEVVEQRYGKPYFGYQPHPEFFPHRATEAFVGAVIARHAKRAVLKSVASASKQN